LSDSIFASIAAYLGRVGHGCGSILRAFVTAAPYLLGQGELRKEVTEQYPDPVSSKTADDLPPRSRGLLFNDIERCTGCGECVKTCPASCITLETEMGPEADKKWVSRFDIDFAKCVFCGLCAESCPPSSLIHSKQYEGAVYRQQDLVASFGRGPVTSEQRAKWEI
jgi:NADH-quinone oxidoreductase subunit I